MGTNLSNYILKIKIKNKTFLDDSDRLIRSEQINEL